MNKIYIGIIILLSITVYVGFDINVEQRAENAELAQELNSASLWLQVTDIRIDDLQERSDSVQRECISLLDDKVADLDDRVEMVGFDCYIDKDYDQRVAVTPISPQGRVSVKTLHCEKYYK